MSGISGISNIDKNSYSVETSKKTSGSSDFSTFLGETKSMDEIFQEASVKYNVPADLLKAIGKAESSFNANAVSRCGAQGVMQLMPGTAKELGVTDAFDAEQNIMGGAKYISRLLKKYDGDTSLALAAYNAGSGNVAKYDGIPPFKETQNYVKKVMGYFGGGNIEIAAETSEGSTTSIRTAMVAPVQSNYSTLLTGSFDSTENIGGLDILFSYEDYMKFIELLFEEEEEQTKESKKDESGANYSTNKITFNASVMNLLKDQNLI